MKEEESSSASAKKQGWVVGGILGRSRYKLWVLAAILLLAFWSMLTGSVTLNWSASNLNPLSDHSPLSKDLDILEVEDREKVVRQMWDVYSHSRTIPLPSFWLKAFEAAYEDLTSDVSSVRVAAISEIAKMSLLSLDIHSPPVATKLRAPVEENKVASKIRKTRKSV